MRIPLLLAATVLVMAGCGDEPGEGANADGAGDREPLSALDGRTFVATSVTDGEAIRHLAAGTELRLTFDDGQLGINAGCNHMAGGYEQAADGSLAIDSISTTEMGCEPKLMAQDLWVAGLFDEAVTWQLTDDQLWLTSGDVRLVLTDREVVSPDADLEGTTWLLDALIADDAVSSIPTGVTASLVISSGTAHVDTGCNAFRAEVIVNGPTITFGERQGTSIDCDVSSAEAKVDAAVTKVLTGSVVWTVNEKSLTIQNGPDGLGFRVA